MLRWLEVFRRKDGRRRILFVCMGNSCRSPMAEAFARAFGGDILVAHSAGLIPSDGISKTARLAMQERRVPIRNRAPRLLSSYDLAEFDLVVNMTGQPLAFTHAAVVIEWDVADPSGMKMASYRAARDRVEGLVRNLVANLRFRDGFAPRRDRAQSVGAGAALRLLVLAALLAGPLFPAPLYEAPADYTGLRTGGDLTVLGAPACNVWISWNIEPTADGGFLYYYEIGGLRPGRLSWFYLEVGSPGLDDTDGLLRWGVVHRRNWVSFYSRGAPVWGNFLLSKGSFSRIMNDGWLQRDSASAVDFIARPGDPNVAETAEPSMVAPLLLSLAAAFWFRGVKRKPATPA